MEISNLTFIVTGDCNYNCTYCPQKKEKKTINNNTIETAVDFFYPLLKGNDDIYIGFYGGEPLLAYEQLEHTVLMLQEKNKRENKKIKFSVTTNGSLLTDEKLEFFHRHKFLLVLSFDGLAQDKGRKKGTLEQMVRLIKRVREYPGIDFEINSVFSPRTINDFSESLRFIIDQEGPEITFNISTVEEWASSDLEILEKELQRLTDFLVQYYKKRGKVPVKNFQAQVPVSRPGPGIFRCGAGEKRLTVTPEGEIWGCFLFYDYFKTRKNNPQYRDYSLGTLTDFIDDYETSDCYPEIMANYSQLRQDFFQVKGKGDFCFLCEDVERCVICPVNAAYSSGALGKISCHHCRLIKIQEKARTNFVHGVDSLYAE